MPHTVSPHDFSLYLHELLQAKAQQQIEPIRILFAQYQTVLTHFSHLQAEVDTLLVPQAGRDYALLATALKQGLQDLEKLFNALVKASDEQYISVVEVEDISGLAELFNCRVAQQFLQKKINLQRKQQERQQRYKPVVLESEPLLDEIDTQPALQQESAQVVNLERPVVVKENAQDKELAQLAARFSGWQKIGTTGEVLALTAPKWQAVIDENTGLMWAVNPTVEEKFPNCSDLTWWQPNKQLNGGAEGFANQGQNTHDWLAYINTKGWCGFHDWRLPTLAELSSLLTKEVSRYYHIREDIFTDMQGLGSRFWTSSIEDKKPDYAWAMYFGYGHDGLAHKSYTLNLRVVRDVK
ncbi:MAG: DUF1566 domain-containing protein [Moraxellaceae bacterium]|nr:DUF1566 domain-containing protein [Moraxellaceae bacterium]